MVFTHKKHYIGSINANNFYYKNDIYTNYNISILFKYLPIELVEYILSYICSSLSVFAANYTIYYINPRDNLIIKTLPSILAYNSDMSCPDEYSISEDGMTLYSNEHNIIMFEYICNELPDPDKPTDKEINTNCYSHAYSFQNTIPEINLNLPKTFLLSNNGKYMAVHVKIECSYIVIYITKTKKIITEIKIEDPEMPELSVINITFSPDNKMIMATYSENNYDYGICIWNITHDILLKYYFTADSIPYNHIVWNPNSTKFAIMYEYEENPAINYWETCIEFGTVINNICTITDNSLYIPGSMIKIAWITNEMFAYSFDHYIFISKDIGNKFVEYPLPYYQVISINASYDGDIIIKYNPIPSIQYNLNEDDEIPSIDLYQNYTPPFVWFDIFHNTF